MERFGRLSGGASDARRATAIRLAFGVIAAALAIALAHRAGWPLSKTVWLVLAWLAAIWTGARWPTIRSYARYRSARLLDQTRSWDAGYLWGLALVVTVGAAIDLDLAEAIGVLAPSWCVLYAGGKLGCSMLGCCAARAVAIRLQLVECLAALALAALCFLILTGSGIRAAAMIFLVGHGVQRLVSVWMRKHPLLPLAIPWGAYVGLVLGVALPIL